MDNILADFVVAKQILRKALKFITVKNYVFFLSKKI